MKETSRISASGVALILFYHIDTRLPQHYFNKSKTKILYLNVPFNTAARASLKYNNFLEK